MKLQFIVNDYLLAWNLLFRPSISEDIQKLKEKLWKNYSKSYMKLEKENVEILKYTSDFIPDDDTIYNFIFESEEFKTIKKQTEKYRKFLMRIWDSHQKEIIKNLEELLRFKIENNYQIMVIHPYFDNVEFLKKNPKKNIVWGKKEDTEDGLKAIMRILFTVVKYELCNYQGSNAEIVNAVEEGRKIYDNIRKVLQFQLSTNMAEVIYVFISSVLGVTIVTPAQLLWINMVTDSTPGLALGMEKAEGDIMSRKPRPANEGLFANGAGASMAIQGVIMACLVLASFFIGQYMQYGVWRIANTVVGVTMAFVTVNFMEMFRAIAMRSQNDSIFTLKTFNYWLLGAFVLTTILTLGIVYIPVFAKIFGFVPLALKEFLISFGLAFSIIPIMEIIKIIKKLFRKK